MTNIYHILDNLPGLEYGEIDAEYEYLATELVKSGLMRIDTYDKKNFVRLKVLGVDKYVVLSARELFKSSLEERAKRKIKIALQNKYQGEELNKKIDIEFLKLKKKVAKHKRIATETCQQLARIFVQASHPIVTRWILLEEVEIYITYENNIGDMLDIKNWQRAGSNSGMQSTNGVDTAIYVACGGDPLAKVKNENSFGDGWPALARFIVIAAQEAGHYADIKRDATGKQLSRHSANFAGTRAKEKAKQARFNDKNYTENITERLNQFKFESYCYYEQKLQFFDKQNIKNIHRLYYKFICWLFKFYFFSKIDNKEFLFLKRYKLDKYPALMIKAMIEDMAFNISPQAKVYEGSNEEHTEAIACIEALARVPQQARKWGHLTTQKMMSNLYNIYYNEVIISLIVIYEQISKVEYVRNYNKVRLPIFSALKNTYNRLRGRQRKLRRIL